jgi:hypothetical protein
MFESIRACIAHAIGAPIRDGIAPHELRASDDVFRQLHECAERCSHTLLCLGQDRDGAVAMVLAAARDAAEPDELHPAVLGAIEQWCREAESAA